MSGAWTPKRFWKAAEAQPEEGGWTVRLDGRPVRTPAKAPLILPTRAMAEASAAEWQSQDEVVKPLTMPVTRSANAAIDKTAHQHGEVAQMVAAYGDSDLLCYRADGPAELVQRQAEAWDPLLDWAARDLGARLEPRTGIMHAPQSAASLEALAAQVAAMDAFALTAFHDLVSLSGSLIIGFAAARGAWEPEALWELSRLDETWQAEQWGVDEEAAEMAAIKRGDFLHARRFWDLSRAD